MFFYLWVVFGLLAVHESFVLSQHRIDFQPHGLAFINALIFAKSHARRARRASRPQVE